MLWKPIEVIQQRNTFIKEIKIPLHSVPTVLTVAAENGPPSSSVVQQTSFPKLTLTGITYSDNATHSRAILEGPEGQRSYAVNTVLESHPDVRISQIHPAKVVLKAGNKEQTIELALPFKKGNAAMPDTLPAPSDIDSLGKYIKATIVYRVDNEITGLRLNNNTPPAVFRKAGLTPGDLAIKMNNRTLQDKQSVEAALADIEQLRTAEFTIIRNEQQHIVKITTQDFITSMDVK
jgi:type II secretion system protein C